VPARRNVAVQSLSLVRRWGGITRYIQRERLLEPHAVVTDPTTTKSVSAIAEDLCFADASIFTRAFKREFGNSPGEVRSAARAGLAPPVQDKTLASSFADSSRASLADDANSAERGDVRKVRGRR
jgi:AraC-like DNA-binding protein